MTSQTVLIIGAAGMLGSRIAEHVLHEPDTRVRMMVRDANLAAEKNPDFSKIREQGAEVFEGNLNDPLSLQRATADVDVVSSAVQGGRGTIVDGQRALLAAAMRSGVRRILPSDFALDLFKSSTR